MKIYEYEQPDLPEDYVDVYYRRKTREITELLDDLKNTGKSLLAKRTERRSFFPCKTSTILNP